MTTTEYRLLLNSTDLLLVNNAGGALLYQDETVVTVASAEGAPPTFWIDIEDSAGNKLGDGPLTTVNSWRHAPQLSRAGSFEFSVSAADPRVNLIQNKRIVRCYALVNGAIAEMGAGVIDKIQLEAGPPAMLRISGDDLARELTYRVVNSLEISTSNDTSPTQVIDYDFSLDTTTDRTDLYDGDENTSDSFGMDAGDKLYIMFERFPSSISFVFDGNTNDAKARLNYSYYNGSDFRFLTSVADLTRVDGAPWAQDGTVSWAIPSDYATGGYGGSSDYIILVELDADYTDTDSVDLAEIYASYPTLASDDIDQIMALAPSGWTLDTANWYSGTAGGSALKLSGETLLEALVKIAEERGENFRIVGREVEWLQDETPDSGVRISGPGGEADLMATESDLAIIAAGGLRRIENTYDDVSRLYAYGAGNGPARMTLASATDSAPTGYTLSGEYLERNGASPRIDRMELFSDIRPLDNSTQATETAANRLLQAAHAYLETHNGYKAYELGDIHGLPASLQVGETVRLVYREIVSGTAIISINEDLTVLGLERRVDAAGIYVAGLTVANVARQPVTAEETLAITAQRLRNYQSYAQELDSNYLVT